MFDKMFAEFNEVLKRPAAEWPDSMKRVHWVGGLLIDLRDAGKISDGTKIIGHSLTDSFATDGFRANVAKVRASGYVPDLADVLRSITTLGRTVDALKMIAERVGV